MKSWSNLKHMLLIGLILVIVSAACTLPLSGSNNQEHSNADLQATIVALQTEMAKTVIVDQETNQPALIEDPDGQITETATQTVLPELPVTHYSGFMVHANGRFISYDF